MNFVSCTSDGVADVTGCLQAEIDSTKPGETLYFIFPTVIGGAYKISAPLMISKPIVIIGDKYTTIKQSTPGKGIFQVASSDVVIRNLNLQGPQYTTQSVNEVAVSVIGPDTLHPLTKINIGDCLIKNFGMYGILMKYVDGFDIYDCDIGNINYAGSMGLSVLNGRIVKNNINNIVATSNAYGIAATRITTSTGELTTDPRSANILISGNRVSNVINWEAIDTHAGSKITITNNWIYKCNRGVSVVDCPNSANVATYGPKDCLVSGNTIDSGVTDGSAIYGISVSGCSSAVGTPTDLSEGCVVSNNVIRGYGQQSNALGMAVYAVSTRGLVVVGNTIIEPGKCGVGLYYNNYGFTIDGNTIQDPWSNTQQAVAISAISDWNRGFIGNNSYVRGSKTATHILEIGLNVNNFPNINIAVTKDYADSAFPLYDPGHHTH